MKPDYVTKLGIVKLLTTNGDFKHIVKVNDVLYYDDKPINTDFFYEEFQRNNEVYVDKDVFIDTLK
jgi:hypothetical protein